MTDQPTEPAGAASHDLTLASSYGHYDQRMVTEAPHPVPGWARGWHLATFVVAVGDPSAVPGPLLDADPAVERAELFHGLEQHRRRGRLLAAVPRPDPPRPRVRAVPAGRPDDDHRDRADLRHRPGSAVAARRLVQGRRPDPALSRARPGCAGLPTLRPTSALFTGYVGPFPARTLTAAPPDPRRPVEPDSPVS